MKPDEEKKIPEAAEAEAPKPGETLPEGALDGVSGGHGSPMKAPVEPPET